MNLIVLRPRRLSGLVILLVTLSLPCRVTADETDPKTPNGIDVGRAKVFDDRTLTLMLEAWSKQIQDQQFVDVKTVAAALGRFQGYRQTDSSSSLTVTTPGASGVNTSSTDTSAINTLAPGVLGTNSSQSNTTATSQAPTAPAPPVLDPFSATLPSQQYGESAGDLLSDQISLTYQIVNLRLLLDKSLSDRVLENGHPRLQAVLGFNITINPPRIANNAVAVVEVTLEPNDTTTNSEGISIVALMPQEHTYNAQALSTKANAFGAAVAVKYVNIGYSQKSRDQTYFLYRDNDTVPFERAPVAGTNATTFGWMFRPVLGRPSVSSENRQLFAVVALPYADDQTNDISKKINVKVRTYWRRFDPETMTSFSMEDANRRAQVLYALSFTLARPLFFNERFQGSNDTYTVSVPTTTNYQANLEPRIHDISWITTGAKTVLVTVTGENFFSETHVAIGDKILTGQNDGLVIKSTETLEFTTTPESIGAAQGGAIIGRYGSGIPLMKPVPPVPAGVSSSGIKIPTSIVSSASAGMKQLDIYLQSANPTNAFLHISDLPEKRFILTINNTAMPILNMYDGTLPTSTLTYKIGTEKLTHDTLTYDTNRAAIVIQALFPETFFKNGGIDVKLVLPFYNDSWTVSSRTTLPDLAYKVSRFSPNTLLITADDFVGFTDPTNPPNPPVIPWKLRIGDDTVAFEHDDTNHLDKKLTSKQLSRKAVLITAGNIPDKVILISPLNAITVLDVPKAETNGDKTNAASTIALNQNDSIWKDITVTDPKQVATVMADTEKLETQPSDATSTSKSSIKVHITRKITATAGKIDLQVSYKPTDGGTNLPPTFVTLDITPITQKK